MMEKYLLIWTACAAAVGIIAESALQFPSLPVLAVGLFCLLISYLFQRRQKNRGALIFFLVFVLASGMVRMELSETHWNAQSQEMAGAKGLFQGVTSGGSVVVEGETPYLRYPVDLASVTYRDGSNHPLRGVIYLYVPQGSAPISTDTALTVDGELSRIRHYKNPGKMDLESRYKSERVIGRIYAASPEAIELKGNAGKYRLSAWAESVKGGLRERFAPYMDPGRLSLLMTLLFGGNYDELPDGVLESFTATGIVHILSVSGSHVALLFGFLILLGKWLHLPRRLSLPMAAGVILFYGMLSGFVPPVIRATVMGVLAAGGLFFDRAKESILLLGAAVLGMLLWEPLYLFDVSFQLSVGASAGILLFYRRFSKEIRRIPRMPGWIAEGIALALAAQILTVPIVLYDFHVLPLYFWLSNLFITPLLEWSIILGLASSLAIGVIEPLAGGMLQLTDYFLWAAMRGNLWLSSLPHAVIPVGGMAAGEIGLYYGAIGLVASASLWRQVRWGKEMAGSLLFVLLFWNGWNLYHEPKEEFFVPDLGAARAAVIHGNGPTVMYYKDSGLAFDIGERELRSVLGYKGIFSADIMMADFSAAKGASPSTLRIPIREIWLTSDGMRGADSFLKSHPESRVRVVKPGILRGTDGTIYASDRSSWAIIRHGNGYFLSGGQPWNGPKLPDVSWLWVGGTSGFQSGIDNDTIQTLQPRLAVYAGSRLPQAGEDRETLELFGIPMVDTYEKGMADITVRGGAFHVKTHIKEIGI